MQSDKRLMRLEERGHEKFYYQILNELRTGISNLDNTIILID